MMRKLSMEEAVKYLNDGGELECQLRSREDVREKVTTVERLMYLDNLAQLGIQKCIIFAKTPSVDIKKDFIKISFDEAYELLGSGQKVFTLEDKEEVEINTIPQLVRKRRANRENLFLYWYE